MADFVRYQLDDGTEVYLESADGTLVSLRGGDPDVAEAVAWAIGWPGSPLQPERSSWVYGTGWPG